MYSLILEGEGGPTEDRENSLIFFLFFIEPFPKEHKNNNRIFLAVVSPWKKTILISQNWPFEMVLALRKFYFFSD